MKCHQHTTKWLPKAYYDLYSVPYILFTAWIIPYHLICLSNPAYPSNPFSSFSFRRDHINSLNSCCLHKCCSAGNNLRGLQDILCIIIMDLHLQGKYLEVKGCISFISYFAWTCLMIDGIEWENWRGIVLKLVLHSYLKRLCITSKKMENKHFQSCITKKKCFKNSHNRPLKGVVFVKWKAESLAELDYVGWVVRNRESWLVLNSRGWVFGVLGEIQEGEKRSERKNELGAGGNLGVLQGTGHKRNSP